MFGEFPYKFILRQRCARKGGDSGKAVMSGFVLRQTSSCTLVRIAIQNHKINDKFRVFRPSSDSESAILLGETILLRALAPPFAITPRMSKALYLHCPVRCIEFNSGITVARDTLVQIEQIAVRMRCPICRDMHLLIEKGELNEDD